MPSFPKPSPRLLDKRERERNENVIDRVERHKCRSRSGGRCEVVEVSDRGYVEPRCLRRATQNHHLLGGIGRRNRGESILAPHRLDVCRECHEEITGHVLKPIGEGRENAATVRFERVR
jgi:hypothetical protein